MHTNRSVTSNLLVAQKDKHLECHSNQQSARRLNDKPKEKILSNCAIKILHPNDTFTPLMLSNSMFIDPFHIQFR